MKTLPIDEAGLVRLIRDAAEPLPALDDVAFAAPFDRFGAARVVLLGEASHGTSEFYRARAAITRRLIERHGFSIVAVEADWPDAASIDRRVRGRPARPGAADAFERFPQWMWRNTDVEAFLGWLAAYNQGRPGGEQAGFYGLDLYNLNASIRAVIDTLDRLDPEAAAVARRRYGCLAPWRDEPQRYGRMALSRGFAPCEDAVVAMLRDLLAKARSSVADDEEDALLDATENARLIRDAEAYYRAMYYGSAESWNLRDRHMAETLAALLDRKGPEAKAVVWAHNSHIGDATATGMGERGELNLGQLVRERFGAAAALIGLGTHTGTVAAADDWDEPMRIKPVNPSRPDSYERLMHDSGVPRFLLDLREGAREAARTALLEPRLERMIGVIYRPDTERWSHYVEAVLPRQFDAFVWFDETRAVTATSGQSQAHGPDDTYPSGL